MIVYICIGNSDDKLTQVEWSGYVRDVDRVLEITHVHGRWFSAPDVPWQSACWCVEYDPDARWVLADGTEHDATAALHHGLTVLAHTYRQDSIAWAQVPFTEFIKPTPPGLEDAT